MIHIYKVHSDTSGTIDEGSMSALILLDLSAAYHSVLILNLKFTSGIAHEELSWMNFYSSANQQIPS